LKRSAISFWQPAMLFSLSSNHSYRYISQKRNLEEAEKLILQLSPDVETVAKAAGKEYELRNAKGEFMLKSDPIGIYHRLHVQWL
jgi:hypothetical protein